MLHMSNLSTKMFMPVFDTLPNSENKIITFILFNRLIAKAKIIQQNNSIKLKFLNELLTNIVF